jgi:purine catabolism regulator
MGITVGEALQLPELKQTKLVAGFEGIEREIKWMTILEIIEDISRIQEGEFLITTGYGLNKREEDGEKIIVKLAKRKLSAVAIHKGFYLHDIPKKMIEAADAHRLPLIEIPKSMNFSFITKVILEKVVNSQMKLISYSQHIHEELTSLVLQNYGMSTITRKLANMTGSHIEIFNEFGETINMYPKSSNNKSIVQNGENDMVNNKFSYPILVDEKLYGFLFAKKADPFSQYEQLAIQQATTIFAIEFLKLKIVDDTKLYLQGDFLDDLIGKGYVNEQAAIERGHQLGYDLAKQNTVMLIQTNRLEEVTQITKNVAKIRNQSCMLRQKPDRLVVLHVSDHGSNINDGITVMCNEVIKQYKSAVPNDNILIGIGNPVHGVEAITESARQSHYSLLFSKYMKTEHVRYDDLGPYRLFIQLKENGSDLKAFYMPMIGPLIEYDQNRQSQLMKTFEAYIENNLKLKNTADALYIHRHTLTYRLNQMNKKTGKNVHNAGERMELHLAMIAYRVEQMLAENE